MALVLRTDKGCADAIKKFQQPLQCNFLKFWLVRDGHYSNGVLACVCVCGFVWVCVCVCVRERE